MNSLVDRLTKIDQKLLEIQTIPRQTVPITTETETLSFQQVIQLQERLMSEFKAFSRKLDSTQGQNSATLSTIVSRSTESLQLLQKALIALEKVETGTTGLKEILTSKLLWGIIFVVGAGVTALSYLKAKREGYQWGSGRSRKMI